MPITAEFLISAASIAQLPKDNLPEIAFAGRSNVGKSSLINKMLGKSGLAKTSKTPGRTQQLNYFRVKPEEGNPFYLVDMPGFGFAAVNKKLRQSWGQLIDEYLSTRQPLRAVVHLVDLRHPPQPLDHQMANWLKHYEVPFLIVGTKADKIAKTKVPEALLRVAEDLHIDSRDTLAFSAETGLGRDELWARVLEMVNAQAE